MGDMREPDDVSPLASLGPASRYGATPMMNPAEFLEPAPLIEQPLRPAERLEDLLRRRAETAPLPVLLDDSR
jgi:hypothetical protein